MQLIYLSHSKPPTGKTEGLEESSLTPMTKLLFRDAAQLQNTWQAARNSLREKKENQSCLSYQINPFLLVNSSEKLGSSASWEQTPTHRAQRTKVLCSEKEQGRKLNLKRVSTDASD